MMDDNLGVWQRGHFVRLNARRLALSLAVLVILSLFAQVTFGASIVVIIYVLITAAIGLMSFATFGAYNAGAWLVLFYVLGNVVIAVYGKTVFGQSLDSNLYSPYDSFLIEMIATIALVTALVMVRYLRLGRPFLRSISNPGRLRWLSWWCFGLGVPIWFTDQYLRGVNDSGFGGLSVFRDILMMAVIARTAMLQEQSQGRTTIDSWLLAIIGVCVCLGLLSNSKAYAAFPVICYFATLLFYRGGLPLRQIVALVIGGVMFLTIFVPMIQAWRYLGQQQLSMPERTTLILQGVEAALGGNAFGRYQSLAKIQFRGGYYDYFGGNGKGQAVLGRYASVQQIDPVINEVNRKGTLGGSVIWPALTRLLPHVIYPGKDKFIESYHIVVRLGLSNPSGGKFPTVPLAGQAYAAYGWPGVISIPFLTFLGFLLALKKLGWHLYRNVYGIFLFCDFIVVYANQGTLNQYAGAVLRNFPLLIATFWVINFLYRRRRTYADDEIRLRSLGGGV